MALQWMILTYMVVAEVAPAILLTLSMPKLLKNRLVPLVSLILQPVFFIIPFVGFQLLGNFSAPISDLVSLIIYHFFIFGEKFGIWDAGTGGFRYNKSELFEKL